MNSVERIECVLAGRLPDRPPFSFWYHFPADQVAGTAAVRAHLEPLERYGMDFLKVMNDNPYPHAGLIKSVEDLGSLTPLHGDEPEFERQLELIATLKNATGGRLLMTTTIFNAWMVLRLLIQPPRHHLPPSLDAAADGPSRWIRQAWAKDPGAVEKALRVIGASLANFARRCVAAGADGVFLSVRDDWVDAAGEHQGLYERAVRPTDLQILAAVSGARFNMLHVCGRGVGFRAFGQYPVQVLNWADRAAGPAIADVKGWLRPALCGGVDNLSTLPNGTPEDVVREVADAVRQAAPRPIFISPGCTFDPARVPGANLAALADAAKAAVNRSGPVS